VTGSDPYWKWRHRKSRNRKWRTSRKCTHAQPVPAHFFLTIVVVQNVSLRMTDVATESQVTPNGFPWKSARTRHQKLHNIRPSGASSPKMT
jgi:hypothetical protein